MGMASIFRLQIGLAINLLFVTVMTGFLVYIFINSKRTRVLFSYCFMHTLIILIFAFDFASSIAPDIIIRWYCIAATYIVKLFLDVLFILYIRRFFSPGKKVITLVLVIIYISSGTLLIISNSFHHLFIGKMTANETFLGILFYFLMGTGYIIQTTGMLCIMKYWIGRLDNQAYRILSSVLALASILILHLFLLKIPGMPVDIFPLLILAGFTVYFIGANKYGMFDTISFGSKHGVEMFTDALLITDRRGRVLYKNKACGLLKEKTVQIILGRFLDEAQHEPAKLRGSKTDIEIVQEDGTEYYSVTVKPVKSGLFSSGKTIFIIHNNTKIVSAISQLSERNQYLQEMNESIKTLAEDTKKLAVLSERNLLAKEIHDVMGHSLILALNTMESNKLLFNDKPVAAMRRIKQAVSEISCSLEEIASARDHGSDSDNTGVLSAAVRPDKTRHTVLAERLDTLAARLSEAGITLELAAMDDLGSCPENVINTIYRVCQESVTNAIKHGQASRITISTKKRSGAIELFIVDNGKGCTSFIKGTGLTGMEERVRELNGTISFGSFEDRQGFMVRVSIPI